MPRSFDVVTESPASVEQVHAAFRSEQYWHDRFLGTGIVTAIDSLLIEEDGAVAVQVTQYLGRQLLPGPVAKFIPADLILLYRETWRPAGDRRVRGQIAITVSGAVGSSNLDGWLVPAAAAGGSQLRFAGSVEVKIPLVGGKLERSLGTQMTTNLNVLQDFTTTWIAEHG